MPYIKRKRYSRKPHKKSYIKRGNKVYVAKKSAPVTMGDLRKAIRGTILKNTELKYTDTSGGKSELYHNSYYLLANLTAANSTYFPDQGDGPNNRDGAQIRSSSIAIKWIAGLKADRLNTQFRILIFTVPKDINPASYTNVFDNTTGNVMLDPVNHNKVKVLYQRYVKAKWFAPVNGTTDELTIFGKIKIPFKHIINFTATNSQVNDLSRNVHICVLPYDTYGALITDNIMWFQYWSRFYFKDM